MIVAHGGSDDNASGGVPMTSPRCRKFDVPRSGEWIRPIPRGYRLACCDCELVHRVNFQIVADIPGNTKRCRIVRDKSLHVEFQVFRDQQTTARHRTPGHIIICVPRPPRRRR